MPVWQGEDHVDALATASVASSCSLALLAGGAGASANWPAADRAIFIPFRIGRPTVVAQLWWYNGTKTGTPNVDCGIYAFEGRRLTSAGSTAQGTSSVLQAVNITDILLASGLYYFALAVSANNTGIFRAAPGLFVCRAFGMAQQASAMPLPTTATFAACASSYVPVCGFTSRTVL